MGAALFVLGALAFVALSAHVALVVLTFRASRRWGLLGLLLPPVAWIGAFRGRVRQRVVAGIALGCLLLCVGCVVDGLLQLGHAIDVGGVSVGEPRHT